MGKPSTKAQSYVARAEKMGWNDLDRLWSNIKEGKTEGWDEGKAFEHLVVRAFGLSGLVAEYLYDVPPEGQALEQIDGIVFQDGLAFLLECKDKASNDVRVIAKMRQQLERRPPTTLGCIFVSGVFTWPALQVLDLTSPQRILLWHQDDIEEALVGRRFGKVLLDKYRDLCRFGMTDRSPNYRSLGST